MDIDEILRALVQHKGSDLHLKVGRPPLFRIAGDLLAQPMQPVTRQELREVLVKIMPPAVRRNFDKTLEADFAYELPGFARYRANVFVQRQDLGAVFRAIPLVIPTIERLGLPEVFRDVADYQNGLVVVTGPTGSGKSTTLAAIIQHVNQTRPAHIVTIEDPIEFVYTDEVATINQRELGTDTYDLMAALKSALRQDPDVILMGEMRDVPTMEFALKAAETGHLVLSTLHTNDARQTLDRIISAFSKSEFAEQIRTQLSLTLRAVICQRLARRADGTGLVAALEILINTTNVRQLIADNATRDIEKVMAADTYYKMQTFNKGLLQMVKQGVVTEEEALATSATPEDLKLGFRGVTRGSTSDEFARGGQQAKFGGFQKGFEFK